MKRIRNSIRKQGNEPCSTQMMAQGIFSRQVQRQENGIHVIDPMLSILTCSLRKRTSTTAADGSSTFTAIIYFVPIKKKKFCEAHFVKITDTFVNFTKRFVTFINVNLLW
jgi:hypothetical protein